MTRGTKLISWGWRMLRLKPKMAGSILATILCLIFVVHERQSRRMLEAGAEATVNVIKALGMKSTASFVLPDEKTVILQPMEKNCENDGSDIFALFMIISGPDRQEQRDVIRSTLGTTLEAHGKRMKEDQRIKLLFFLGLSTSNITDFVRDEYDQYGDVVVDNMVDTYLNLTVKTLRMLKWAQENCREVKYLIKLDDDVHVNVPKVLKFLQDLPEDESRNLIAGYKYDKVAIVTDPTSKWYVPTFLWPQMELPYFAAGFFYIIGVDAVPKLFNASLRTPHLFHLEDVFLTGIVATNTLHMEIHHIEQIARFWAPYLSYITKCSSFQELMAVHMATADDLKCWNQLNNNVLGEDFKCEWKPIQFYC